MWKEFEMTVVDNDEKIGVETKYRAKAMIDTWEICAFFQAQMVDDDYVTCLMFKSGDSMNVFARYSEVKTLIDKL